MRQGRRHDEAAEPPLMLSVSGARGLWGSTMTPETAARFAAAFGSFVGASGGDGAPLVCVGRDSRPSGLALQQAAMGGLAGVGCRVVDLGVVATPTVGVMIAEHRANGGLVVTASHNPIEWNGLKCLTGDGIAPPPDAAAEITRRFREGAFEFAPPETRGEISRDDTGASKHLARVLGCIDGSGVRQMRPRVVLDSVNGAGCLAGRLLLEALGCEVVHLNGEPTGRFAHAPEPIEENLRELARRTKAEGAAVGFAQDPDADRLALVDETGRYIGEEYTLVLAAKRVLDGLHAGPDARGRSGSKREPHAGPEVVRGRSSGSESSSASGGGGGGVGGGLIAVNLSTSRMIDDLASRYPGVQVVRAAVGEANVVAAMKAAGGRALLGGEGNGGVILPGVCWVRDSLSAMALVLGLLADAGRPLSEVVDSLPRYTMIKHKFDLSTVGGREAVARMIEKVRKRFRDEDLNDADGLRVDVADGWVHLRPSNTEPIVRLIAEAKTDSRAWELMDEVAVAAGVK